MAAYDQLLPEDESFAAPDWLAATDGSGAYNAPPYLFHYLAYNPTTDLTGSRSPLPSDLHSSCDRHLRRSIPVKNL